jgi:type I restriction enzyme R subunit
VQDEETSELIFGASVSVRLSGRLLAETRSNDSGGFEIHGLPGAVVDVFVTASGFTRRQLRVDTTSDDSDGLLVALRKPSQGDRRVRISGVEVTIADEVEVDLGDGNVLKPTEYLDRARAVILGRVPDVATLRSSWQRRDARAELEEYLAVRQVTPELLGLVLARPDVDAFDLLANVAFGVTPIGLDARATAAQVKLGIALPHVPAEFVAAVLDKYRLGGVAEVSSSELFALVPFTGSWGGVLGVTQMLGGVDAAATFLRTVQTVLFDTETDE